MTNTKITFLIVDDDGFENEFELPAKYEVCPRCEGKGKHTNPSIDGNGITSEEWNGPDWDDESRAMYFSGGYDVPCEVCRGARVVLVVDAAAADPAILQLYREKQRYDHQRAHEDRMGY